VIIAVHNKMAPTPAERAARAVIRDADGVTRCDKTPHPKLDS
jgi:hypothetical protein